MAITTPGTDTPRSTAGSGSAVLAVIALATAIRISIGGTIGLGVDESYAAAVARPLSASYYDHPPLSFWIAGVVEWLGGAGHPLLLRAPFIALFAGTSWLIFRLTERRFGARAGLYAVIVLNLIPVFGVSGGGWVLPDGPLLFSFAVTAWSLTHIATATDGDRARRWWLAAGGGAGLAMLSKYHAIFLFTGALFYFISSRRNRWRLSHAEPYVAALIAAGISYPVFAWNARHQWISFAFQSGRAGRFHGPHVAPLLQNVAGQAGYLLPWFWVPLCWIFGATIWRRFRGDADETALLLTCLASGPIVAFTILSLGGNAGLPHWPAPGYFLLVPLLGAALSDAVERGNHRHVRRWLVAATAVSVALFSLAATQIVTGWVSRALPSFFRRGDPSLDALDWTEVTRSLGRVAGASPNSMIVATSWIDAAKLGAAASDGQTVLCFNDDARHFRFVGHQRDFVGTDGLIVVRSGSITSERESLRRAAAYFQSVDSLFTMSVHRSGHPALELLVYRGNTLLRPYDYPAQP